MSRLYGIVLPRVEHGFGLWLQSSVSRSIYSVSLALPGSRSYLRCTHGRARWSEHESRSMYSDTIAYRTGRISPLRTCCQGQHSEQLLPKRVPTAGSQVPSYLQRTSNYLTSVILHSGTGGRIFTQSNRNLTR